MDAMMRQAFVRLGFTQAGAACVVNEQGITTVEELGLLTDDEIEGLCKTIRRPGGTVAGQPKDRARPRHRFRTWERRFLFEPNST